MSEYVTKEDILAVGLSLDAKLENLNPAALAELVFLVDANVVNNKTAKFILPYLFLSPCVFPSNIIHIFDLYPISEQDMREIILKVLEENKDKIKNFKGNTKKAGDFLTGQVMRSHMKVDPAVAKEIIAEVLDSGEK